MYQGITLLLAAVFVTVSLLAVKNNEKAYSKFIKIVVLVFCAVGFFRFMLSDSFVFVINGGYYGEVFYDATDPLQTILRWGYYLNYAVIPMAAFFDSRLFKNITVYVCLPFSLLSCAFFNDYMHYFLSAEGKGLHLVPWFRYTYFILELALAIAIPLIIAIKKRHVFAVKDKREWKNFLLSVPPIILLLIPVYAPQSLFGYSKLIAKQYSTYHLLWAAVLVAATAVLYYVFRFKSQRDRYMLCIFLTIVLFFNYDSLYLMGFSIPRLPIQLCNLAAYFYIIAIPFKMKRMFQFCFIANVTGALLAIILPDFLPGAFGFWNMHFVLEHTLVFMIPVLAMGLRVFPRSTKVSLKYTFIGFSIYFIFCLTSGIILNGYSAETGFEVNYFFLFDLDKALGWFPFLKFTEDFHFTFGRFGFYPLFVAIIYVCFLLLCVVFYHAVKIVYKVEDDHLELRKSAIDLYEKTTGKELRVPKDFID